MRQAWIVWSVAYVKRDKIRFANFTRYRGSRQGLVQARTLTRYSRKKKKRHERFFKVARGGFEPSTPRV